MSCSLLSTPEDHARLLPLARPRDTHLELDGHSAGDVGSGAKELRGSAQLGDAVSSRPASFRDGRRAGGRSRLRVGTPRLSSSHELMMGGPALNDGWVHAVSRRRCTMKVRPSILAALCAA